MFAETLKILLRNFIKDDRDLKWSVTPLLYCTKVFFNWLGRQGVGVVVGYREGEERASDRGRGRKRKGNEESGGGKAVHRILHVRLSSFHNYQL